VSLEAIIAMLRAAKGIAHKADIAPVLARLNLGGGGAGIPVGDDCAAIPDGDGFLLLAIEGFMPEFCAADPYFAGYCGVMVNVSDVAAMGGRPIAVVDALWSPDGPGAAPMLAGLAEASSRYNVPVIGGHTNTRAAAGMLSVAILGRAQALLTSFDAQPDQILVAAVDPRGRMRDPALYWDASSAAPAARLRTDLEILPEIAERKLCGAAKDISMAGVVGTALMLLEASGLGGVIDLAALPRPEQIPLERWLLAFPSFGFLLSVPPGNVAAVISRFSARGIAAAAIGVTDASRVVRLRNGAEDGIFWRFDEDPLIGCNAGVPEHA
jgi:AIR synthase-related protein